MAGNLPQAFIAGMAAGRSGTSVTENPFRGALSFMWLRGYAIGQRRATAGQ